MEFSQNQHRSKFRLVSNLLLMKIWFARRREKSFSQILNLVKNDCLIYSYSLQCFLSTIHCFFILFANSTLFILVFEFKFLRFLYKWHYRNVAYSRTRKKFRWNRELCLWSIFNESNKRESFRWNFIMFSRMVKFRSFYSPSFIIQNSNQCQCLFQKFELISHHFWRMASSISFFFRRNLFKKLFHWLNKFLLQ